MRILLDAKDLIELIERNRPIDVAALNTWLKGKSATLVLSLTNVSDFVGPVFAIGDFLEMRVLLQRLETLPISYIREGLIIRDELKAALIAYQAKEEPCAIEPYASRWDETLYWECDSAAKLLVALRLDEIVYMVRGTIQAYKRYTAGLEGQITAERQMSPSEQLEPKEIFINSIPARLAAYGIAVGDIDLRAFGEWLWSSPSRCLGLWLHFEAYHQLLKDKAMPVQAGDIADFAHIAAIPYVDFVTVDKRIGDILTKVFRRLRPLDARSDLSVKVFTKISDLLAT